MNVVAFGPTENVFTAENLQKTYGGRLTILSEVASTLAAEESGNPVRR
jgi:manganese/zinc/iron transport system ATP- binding protein